MQPSRVADAKSSPSQWLGVGRAIGGAVIFGLPLLMTMEVWWLGYYMDPLRLLLLLLVSFPLLVGVSSVIGFTDSRNLFDNIVDVFVAYALGFLVSGLTLLFFNTVAPDERASIHFNMVMLQTIPASLGALLARSELGSGEHDRMEEKSWGDQLVVLAVGALFLALNVAPTEEILMISYQMSSWHLLCLFLATLLVMAVFGVAGGYSRGVRRAGATPTVREHLSYTCVACLVAVGISVTMLWIFGRTDGLGITAFVSITVVLLFPAGIGAAAARLII